jgi:hypothetical protein
MSKTDGIGVLSLSLEFLHVKRWPRAESVPVKPNAPDEHGLPCSVFVAVNFDDPAPLEADVTELPSGDVRRRANLATQTGLWHGLRLASMRDILHVEVRVPGSNDTVASFSGPVTSFLEEAFLESDARGVRKTFELGDAAEISAQLRVKFHLQADILRALCDGVGVEVASVDTIKAFAPQAVTLCGAAETLTTARRRSLSGHESFDAKAAAQEREESAAFRQRAKKTNGALDDTRSEGALNKSYAALTAGVKRFLASRRADDADDRASNLVRLLSDAR